MAENIISQPPLTIRVADENGHLSKAWAIWFRDLYRRVGFKGDNSIDENESQIQAVDIKTDQNAANLTAHEGLATAHGSNGEIVGKDDIATEALVGLVKQMALVVNAVASTVSVDSPDASAAPAVYDQTKAQEVVTLANEMKADLNTLVTDLNNAITQVNALFANSKTAGQMNNA